MLTTFFTGFRRGVFLEGSARFPSLWKKRKRRADFTTAKSLRLRLPEYPNGTALGWQKIMIVLRSCSPYIRGPRQYWILDSTPWIPDSLSEEIGFRILKPGIPDFTSKNFPGSEFQKQNFPGIQNPDSFTSGNVVIRA